MLSGCGVFCIRGCRLLRRASLHAHVDCRMEQAAAIVRVDDGHCGICGTILPLADHVGFIMERTMVTGGRGFPAPNRVRSIRFGALDGISISSASTLVERGRTPTSVCRAAGGQPRPFLGRQACDDQGVGMVYQLPDQSVGQRSAERHGVPVALVHVVAGLDRAVAVAQG